MNESLGLLETTGWTPAMVALDIMEKTGKIRVWQAELNDFLGVIIKVIGSPADVAAALASGRQVAEQLQGRPVTRIIPRVDPEALRAIGSAVEYNPLIEQYVVQEIPSTPEKPSVESQDALGFIETQGFTAVFDAIDTACKAANVTVVGKEKLGGGYVTVVVQGDVAAVTAAIEAGKTRVEELGKLIAAHVIARPSASVRGLLPG